MAFGSGGTSAPFKVEVLIVTGLPGSGRSSLVAALLRDLPSACRVAVCVHRHANAFSLETTSLPLLAPACIHYSEAYDFGSGCLCCSPDGDVTRLLNELERWSHETRPTHLLIETTGVADPEPFIALLSRRATMSGPLFGLLGVLCVVDCNSCGAMLQDATEAPTCSVAGRGLAQLRAADVLVLNKLDQLQALSLESKDLDARVKSTHEFAISLARPAAAEPTGVDGPISAEVDFMPACIGPTVYCSLNYREVRNACLGPDGAWRRGRLCPPPSNSLALPLQPLFSLALGPAAGHGAAFETACISLPRGGVRLDPALAMFQALLDGGEVLRIQGYLSFLPSRVEAGEADLGSSSSGWVRDKGISDSDQFPVPLARAWALPMITMEGMYRRPLQVRSVEAALAPGSLAKTLEESGLPWQETAYEAAASDRGACKVFLCGYNLDERVLQLQLARTNVLKFGGVLACNLESLIPSCTQALASIDEAVAATLDNGVGSGLLAGCAPFPSLSHLQAVSDGAGAMSRKRAGAFMEERASAEAFAEHLVGKLQESLSYRLAAIKQTSLVEVPLPNCSDRGHLGATSLRWENGRISIWSDASVHAPLGCILGSGSNGRTSMLGSELRFCVKGTFGVDEKQRGNRHRSEVVENCNGTPLKVLVVGSDIYCRQHSAGHPNDAIAMPAFEAG